MWRRAVAKYRVSIRSTSSGSADSDVEVKPTRSQNNAVMTLRSSASATWSGKRDPQLLQNFDPSGFRLAQTAHVTDMPLA